MQAVCLQPFHSLYRLLCLSLMRVFTRALPWLHQGHGFSSVLVPSLLGGLTSAYQSFFWGAGLVARGGGGGWNAVLYGALAVSLRLGFLQLVSPSGCRLCSQVTRYGEEQHPPSQTPYCWVGCLSFVEVLILPSVSHPCTGPAIMSRRIALGEPASLCN